MNGQKDDRAHCADGRTEGCCGTGAHRVSDPVAARPLGRPSLRPVAGSGDDERARRWARAICADLKPWASGAVYLNFIGDEGEDRVVARFGRENYARLASVKRQYDPDNVFHLNHNISPPDWRWRTRRCTRRLLRCASEPPVGYTVRRTSGGGDA